jgi:seryl-tRNA(Sec) selenium transferase
MATSTDYSKTGQITNAQAVEAALKQYEQQEVRTNKFPTEIIDLPSKGYFYPQDSALAKGTVEMKYMTAREEDILSSANLIKQGVVLDKLFQSLIVDSINYDDLLLVDKNQIMIAARVLGYGKDYEVEVSDPFSTDTKQKVVIDLLSIKPKDYDFESVTPGTTEFHIILPASKREITFQLMTHGLESEISARLKKQTKAEKDSGISRELSTRMKYAITSVDGNRDRSAIENFVERELFSIDAKALRSEIKRVSPDLDLTFTFVSKVTGESIEMDIPIDTSFFWPRA